MRKTLIASGVLALLGAGLLVAAAPASASDFFGSVDAGTSLVAGDRLIATNQAYGLTVQTDGNVVERHGATAVWTTNTAGNAGARLDVQADGNLVVRSSTGRALWNSGSPGHHAMYLLLADDGGLGMYASTGPAFWSNGIGTSTPRATLTAGQSLRSASGDRLYSPSNRFQVYPGDGLLYADENVSTYGLTIWNRGRNGAPSVLTMQTDGNLVLRGTNGVAYWATGTRGAGNRFTVQDDGNLVVRRADGGAAWASGTTRTVLGSGETAAPGARFVDLVNQGQPATATVVQTDGNVVRTSGGRVTWSTGTSGNAGARLTMQTDGNLVLRRPDGRAIWQTGTSRCGANTVFDTINQVVYSPAHGIAWVEFAGSQGVC